MKRLFQNPYATPVLSLLGVLAAYWLYAGIVVPVVLPRDDSFMARMRDTGAIPEDAEWKKYLADLFQEKDWERSCKFSIWKDNFVLLFDDYKEKEVKNGREVKSAIEMNPCTVLFLTGERGKDDEKLFREAIILQSTGGATLGFDGPFNPLAGNKVKFVNGQLAGKVVIRSDMKEPGPKDDLLITTQNVIFSDSQILANSDVDFRFGMSHGTGNTLSIFLASSDPRNSRSEKTISRMELQRVNKIYLNAPSDRKTPTGEPQYDSFEVTCRNIEFAPDPNSNLYWMGTFNTDVDIVRRTEGSYDHLVCSQLQVQFAPKPKSGEKPIPNNELGSLQQLAPRKMLAVGNAKVRSPNNNDFLAEGNKLEYDFEKGRLVLDSDLTLNKTVKLSLYGGKQWVVSEKISYKFGENGQFGELFALNGGKVYGIMSPEKPPEQQRTFQLDWTDKLEAYPDTENPELVRCQLFGQMSMNVEKLGTMYAKETVIWFKQKLGETSAPPATARNPLIRQVSGAQPQTTPLTISSSGSSQQAMNSPAALTGSFQSLTPSHARIRKDVRFVTENGVCDVREMNVWFYEDGQEPSVGPQQTASPTSNPAIALPQQGSSRSFLGGNSNGSQFELLGDTMELLVKMRGNAMEIGQLILGGGGKRVSLEEKNPKQPSDPIKMYGTEIRAWSPSSDHSVVQLLGTPSIPATIAGMESTVTALDMTLNQQTNQIKIEGGGEITSTQLALSNDLTSSLAGSPAANASPVAPPQKKLLVVRWAGGMNFDGTRISFEKSVVAKYPGQELFCNVLNLDLDQPVSLIQPKTQNAKVRRIECLGKVFFVCEEYDQTDPVKKKSVLKGENLDQIQLFPETGQFDGTAQGTGQGRLWATFLDKGGNADVPGTNTNLTRVDLYFYGRVLGNFKLFDATATNSVICIYCPVPTWDAEVDVDNREQLKEKEGYRLDCDVLEVAKAIDPQTQQQGLEITASGRTIIEGKQIFSRAESVKFNQLKETVIVEGTPAEVYIKRTADDEYEEPIFVQQLIYNLRTKNFETKGARGTQFLK
ncbi:MAG: hypothetical protein FWC43_10010 [Planctomycetaceae bacterium]|nr:hypothetical protein [Planctomycetaceae bacterium]